MRTPTPLFRMADKMAGGRLAEIIANGRAEGLSFDDIARRLYADFGIEVTRQTVANWCPDLVPAAPAAPTEEPSDA